MAKTENQVRDQSQVVGPLVTVDNNNNNNNNSNQDDANNNNNDNNNNNNSNDKTHLGSISSGLKTPTSGKYQLRPRSLQARRFCEADWSFQETIRDIKPRTQPLSRYRRKTANARERYRMRQINTAFESLRGVLPSWVCSRRAASDLTKITTLRLASAYIRALQDILDGNTSEDSCPWVFSALLSDNSQPTSKSHDNPADAGKSPGTPSSSSTTSSCSITTSKSTSEADFVSLLCSGGEDAVALDEAFESFTHLSPISDNDPVTLLLLGADSSSSTSSSSSRCWVEGQHVSLVT